MAVTVSHISSTVVILATSPCFGLECSRRCSRALNTHTHTTSSTCRRPLNFAPTAAHTWRRWEIENVCCCGKSLQSWQIEIAVCCDDDVYEENVTCCRSANNCKPQRAAKEKRTWMGLNGDGLISKGLRPGGGGGIQTLASPRKTPNKVIYMTRNREN
uniref:HDC06420 n=1 Tax=Drosophila melanogaster TaxID=7227 RepID=Q6IGF7_DROME|nr:TPA_inf: HDC06420 [Drosophila melanogaster]